jgi:TPR repeat protein
VGCRNDAQPCVAADGCKQPPLNTTLAIPVITFGLEAPMRLRVALGAICVLFLTPCFASHLEEGVKSHERKDYAAALSTFGKAAATGNAEAQRRLGFMYYHGEGVPQDNKRAVALFEKAAVAGDIESASNLGKMYEFGMGVGQDDNRAASWYLKAAESGDPTSQFRISVMYYQGQGVARDRIEAAKWWTLAMSHGREWAERFRPSVDSAEGKLTPEENAEGKRLAAEWLKTRAGRR